jgi:hypothetical protein
LSSIVIEPSLTPLVSAWLIWLCAVPPTIAPPSALAMQ